MKAMKSEPQLSQNRCVCEDPLFLDVVMRFQPSLNGRSISFNPSGITIHQIKSLQRKSHPKIKGNTCPNPRSKPLQSLSLKNAAISSAFFFDENLESDNVNNRFTTTILTEYL